MQQLASNKMSISDDSADAYLSDISNITQLTTEESFVLGNQMGYRDDELRNKVFEGNLKLVVSIARKYEGRGIPLVDLVQEGNIGLLMAIEECRWDTHLNWTTYLIWHIRKQITSSIISNSGLIKLPFSVVEDIRKITRETEILIQELERTPKECELSAKLSMGIDKINKLVNLASTPIFIDGLSEEESDLFELIEDKDSNVSEKVELDSMRTKIIDLLDCLHPFEKEVVTLRFGINEAPLMLMDEVAKQLKCSREKIRITERKALLKLKRHSKTLGLDVYL